MVGPLEVSEKFRWVVGWWGGGVGCWNLESICLPSFPLRYPYPLSIQETILISIQRRYWILDSILNSIQDTLDDTGDDTESEGRQIATNVFSSIYYLCETLKIVFATSRVTILSPQSHYVTESKVQLATCLDKTFCHSVAF